MRTSGTTSSALKIAPISGPLNNAIDRVVGVGLVVVDVERGASGGREFQPFHERLATHPGRLTVVVAGVVGWLAAVTISGSKLSPFAEKHARSNSGSLSARAQKPWPAKLL